MDFQKISPDTPSIIFLDGLWGSGKSLLGPILGSFERVSPPRIDWLTEAILAICVQGKISPDAASTLIAHKIIENHFNSFIGREINLRPSDDSSLLKFMKLNQIIGRMFSAGNDASWQKLARRGDKYVQITHMLSLNLETLATLLKTSALVLVMRRNPVFMFEYWVRYLSTFNRTRELTLSGFSGGERIPFFAFEWEEEWGRLSLQERAALGLARCSMKEGQEVLHQLESPDGSVKVLPIYFRKFLANPTAELHGLQHLTNQTPSRHTIRVFASQLRPKGWWKKGASAPRDDLVPSALERRLLEVRSQVSESVFQEFHQSVRVFEQHEADWAD